MSCKVLDCATRVCCAICCSAQTRRDSASVKDMFQDESPRRPLHAQRLCGVYWPDRRSGVSQELKTSSVCFSAQCVFCGFSLTSRPDDDEAGLRLVYAGTPPEMETEEDNRVSPSVTALYMRIKAKSLCQTANLVQARFKRQIATCA